jgi:hypothetical protein
MAADLFDRVRGINTTSAVGDTKISEHDIYAMLTALADGEMTRAQIENAYDIPTTGAQATDLDWLINTYNGITGGSAALRREKYLNRVHSVFMISTGVLRDNISKADIQTWLTNAAA